MVVTHLIAMVISSGPQGLWDSDKHGEGLAEANLSTLNSFGEPFMDAVCKNACSGHDVARVRPHPPTVPLSHT